MAGQYASTTVERDPFARGEYRRFTIPNRDGRESCDWCGQSPRRLYSYVWENDGSREAIAPDKHRFCNAGCRRAYRCE